MLFDGWYENAKVRNQPARTFDPLLRGYLPFSSLEVPEIDHPAVQALGPGLRSRVLTHHLYRYLRYTMNMETRVVSRALIQLATGNVGMELSGHIRENALKILTDEGFHAFVAMNMFHQVVAATKIEPVPCTFDIILDRLDAPIANPTARYEVIRHLLQVCVFETMVTSILDRLPADQSVHPTVRDLVADHAFDERRHNAFFVRFFPELWTALDPSTRLVVARDLPGIINACLAPDLTTVRAVLADVGMSRDTIEDVICDCYSSQNIAAATRWTARYTIQLIRNTGVLDTPEGWDAFTEAGLLDGADADRQ
ncbi:hypothetical protein FDG2_5526 [Candidatus Protofrankia californiensis]|uniref:p-aminobenzoate N-oxygenase AurF n=1 Tax=Candidatus Protofrankia californiensis TaxID=1839754 RepID=A0A1C3PE37_9ACTN|nr:hypothetical protein FDG2_5526 [Candidatus Protofrankia californiensis]